MGLDFGNVAKDSKDDMEVFEMSPLSRTAMHYTFSGPISSATSTTTASPQHRTTATTSEKIQPEIKKIQIAVQPKKEDKKTKQTQITKEKRPNLLLHNPVKLLV